LPASYAFYKGELNMINKAYYVILSISILAILVFSGCNDYAVDKNQINQNSKYQLYAEIMGDVKYVEISEITKGNIRYSKPKKIELRKLGLLANGIYEVSGKKVYCPNYRTKGELQKGKVVVLENGKIVKTIKIKNRFGAQNIISDIDKKAAYVMFILQPASYNPAGTPFMMIDTEKDEITKPFNLKGTFYGYDIKDNYIYLTVTARRLGYKEIPDEYIASINRDTQEIKILTPNGLDFCPVDLKIAPNGKIYLVSSLNNPKYDGCNEPKISIYNTDGNFVKEVKLDIPYCNKIVIDKTGIAYINHNNGGELGDTITVFDTNTDKVVGTIEGFNGPSAMMIKDSYLFVSNYNSGKVSVVDLKTREVIGNINLGESDKPSTLIIF